MNVRIAAAAYAVPPDDEAVEAVLERERTRVETTLSALSPESRRKAVDGLGLNRVRICGDKQLYDLVLEAASKAIAEAGITAQDINLTLRAPAGPAFAAPRRHDRPRVRVAVSYTHLDVYKRQAPR